MKRSVFLVFPLFAALCCAAWQECAAADRAATLLERLAAEFRSMGAYGVEFTVSAGDYSAAGRYEVAGESYYLTLGDAEVFCDGKVRYEIDNRRREVVVGAVNIASRNLLDNPAHAFEFLDRAYAVEELGERQGCAVVRLSPRDRANELTVTLTLALDPLRPRSVDYDYDGQHVAIAIGLIGPLSAPLPQFDRSGYAGYEFIDFR